MAEECSVLLCYAAGKLPPSWDKLSLLTDMSLSSNALSGSLPPRLAAISRLDVSNNQFLCGDIPSTNRGNSTLMSERTSLGRQCETIGQAARMSGTLGLILGKPENTFVAATTTNCAHTPAGEQTIMYVTLRMPKHDAVPFC